ncbi:hypothetical protein RI129_005464 [Pyrocoelia pectoralis]|uniref:Carboxylesterase type B domain-containing protein n=1 Tax=Pyrocoelia pectoralis TaxID=417401 RepID=A0AAN7ZHJ0_9COLE
MVTTHLFAVLTLHFSAVLAVLGSAEVTIKHGILKGTVRVTEKQKSFNAFTGIPYAKPPVNELRFKVGIKYPINLFKKHLLKPSTPSDPWNGIFDATNPHSRCLQSYTYLKNYTVIGSEDCLYLNVYTPQVIPTLLQYCVISSNLQIKPENKFAVMVFIHGGAFVTGSAMDYDPNLLIDHDVVLVTINYRLGPLGFFSSGSIDVLGNDGLKDQALAIKWVKNNIDAFGGDPDRITLFGQGAGGISAHLHMISPMSKGLINGVIAQSGTALALNSLMPYFLSIRMSNFLAQRVDCPTEEEIEDMMRCMMTKDGREIIEASSTLVEWDIEPITTFKPVMEPDHKNAFLSADPIDIVLSGKADNVPFMTGITRNEGDFRTGQLFKEPKLVDEFNKNFKDHLSLVLNYKEIATPKLHKTATKGITAFYFKNKKLDESRRKSFSKAYMDAMYLVSANYASDLHSMNFKHPVYYYVFGYKGSESHCNLLEDNLKDNYGVCHSDDLLYLFNSKELFSELVRHESDSEVAELMTKLWTNFAKYGNPTPKSDQDLVTWQPYSAHERKCYVINGGNDVKVVSDCYKERTEFWRNIDLNERTTTLRRDRSKKIKDEL